VTKQTPDITNGKITKITVVNHPDYHDVQVLVDDEEVPPTRTCSHSQEDGARFEHSALQHIVYVKRKNFFEERAGQSSSH